MKHLYFLLGALIPMLLACCTGKKSNEQEAEAQPLFDITAPAFDKFVVVADDEGTPVYKEADTSSPMLVYWTEDIESDMAGVENHWSNEAVKSGYISDSFVAWPGTVYAVLGEEGDFYKVNILSLYCELEAGFIPKSAVSSINTDPLTADVLEGIEYCQTKVVREGQYKGLVMVDNADELWGESLELGILLDGCVAYPLCGKMECANDKAATDIRLDDQDWGLTLYYPDSLKADADEDAWMETMDPRKLSEEQIGKIYETVKKSPVEKVRYDYYNKARGIWPVYTKQ